MTQIKKIQGLTLPNTYFTGGTLNGNSVVLGRTDDTSVLTLSGSSDISITEPVTGTFLIDATVTAGEINTASNLGGGTGVFGQKSGVDLQFKSLTSTGNTVTITNDSTTVNIETNVDNTGVSDANKIFSWYMNVT